MENNLNNFIQKNSPDGGFLQSPEWRKFQENVGRKTYGVPSLPAPLPRPDEGGICFHANIIEHTLPLVGKYFYVPRGPVIGEISNDKLQISQPKADPPMAENKSQNQSDQIQNGIQRLINLAKKNGIGWIRVEPNEDEALEIIKNATKHKIAKAPHDMQPREIFVIDIVKLEEQLLAEMKSKTRYNIRLAIKKGVKISNIKLQISQPKADPPMAENKSQNSSSKSQDCIEEFLRLVKVTAERDGITPHPESYYRKMIEAIPGDILKLYVAEYGGKVIAANLVIFYGDTCTYLHGGSDNENRNVMAPYLLQWRQIQDAKNAGCKKYDFGGVSTNYESNTNVRITNKNSWAGITRFKLGFSPNAKSTKFPGCFDVIINSRKYWLYRAIQKAKSLIK